MCSYCKRLKELKDLDEKEYKKIIQKWRLRDKKACEILRNYKVLITELIDKHERFDFHILDILAFSYELSRLDKFLDCDYVGK